MNAERFFEQTATHAPRTGTDQWGDATYGSPVTIEVRWLTQNEVVRNDEGREVTSAARISTTTDINTGDKVTDENSVEREVIVVRKNRDTRGNFSHYVAHLG